MALQRQLPPFFLPLSATRMSYMSISTFGLLYKESLTVFLENMIPEAHNQLG